MFPPKAIPGFYLPPCGCLSTLSLYLRHFVEIESADFHILKARLPRFKADLVKRLYLRLCYWDLDILYTK